MRNNSSKKVKLGKSTDVRLVIERAFPKILMLTAILGFVASFVLTVDKFQVLANPSIDLPCNISPLISCGSVMNTVQSEAFGFPNSLIGVAGFSMLGTIAFALLAGGRFKRWFWMTLFGGMLFGIVFVHWLIFQSIFVIHTLCPYCMVSWVATIPAFWYVTLYVLATEKLKLPGQYDRAVNFALRHHFDILVVWMLAIACAILVKFWYYWSTLI